MYWVVHPLRPQDFPWPSRCPSGFALGTSLGPREISRSSGMYNPIHPSSRQCTDTLPDAQIMNSTFDISRCTLPISHCLLHNIAYCIVSTMLDATDGLAIVVDTTHSPTGMSLYFFFFNIYHDDEIATLDNIMYHFPPSFPLFFQSGGKH